MTKKDNGDEVSMLLEVDFHFQKEDDNICCFHPWYEKNGQKVKYFEL